MIGLFINYFQSQNRARQDELHKCLWANIENKFIDKIYLITEDAFTINNKKVEVIKADRPTYNDFFYYCNLFKCQYSVIANADIYFDQTIERITEILTNDRALALTRYDIDRAERSTFYKREDSQDAWIFKGFIKNMDGNFYLGRAGCDNRIAWEMHNAGYRLFNPSLTIKAYHLHNTGARNYGDKQTVPKPYRFVEPT